VSHGRRTFLRRLGAGCLVVAGLAIPARVQAFFHRRCQVIPVCPEPAIPIWPGPGVVLVQSEPTLVESGGPIKKVGVTTSSPQADTAIGVTGMGGFGTIPARVQFSASTAQQIWAMAMPTGNNIPFAPPMAAVQGSPLDSNNWSYWNTDPGNKLIPNVAYSASGTANKFVVWWKTPNSGGGLGDWQIEAWTFAGVPAP
jgi:hypothetical protein